MPVVYPVDSYVSSWTDLGDFSSDPDVGNLEIVTD
jgi:hypothetical protein